MSLQKTIFSMFVFSFVFSLGSAVFASDEKRPPLGRFYPGDEGIERDERVLFVEDFEKGGVEEIGARWGRISKKANFSLSEAVHGKSAGVSTIRTANNGQLVT